MNISLEGKIALVCGSTQGIGLATAKELATNGATCILLARNEAMLKEAVSDLPTPLQQKHLYAVADFTDIVVLRSVISNLVKSHTIHILVNNTGGGLNIISSDSTLNGATKLVSGTTTLKLSENTISSLAWQRTIEKAILPSPGEVAERPKAPHC